MTNSYLYGITRWRRVRETIESQNELKQGVGGGQQGHPPDRDHLLISHHNKNGFGVLHSPHCREKSARKKKDRPRGRVIRYTAPFMSWVKESRIFYSKLRSWRCRAVRPKTSASFWYPFHMSTSARATLSCSGEGGSVEGYCKTASREQGKPDPSLDSETISR